MLNYFTVDYLAARLADPAYGCLFLRSTFFFIGWLVGLGPKFLDNGSQPSLNGSSRNLHTSLVWGQA